MLFGGYIIVVTTIVYVYDGIIIWSGLLKFAVIVVTDGYYRLLYNLIHLLLNLSHDKVIGIGSRNSDYCNVFGLPYVKLWINTCTKFLRSQKKETNSDKAVSVFAILFWSSLDNHSYQEIPGKIIRQILVFVSWIWMILSWNKETNIRCV